MKDNSLNKSNDLQLSISNEHIWLSMGKNVRSILHMAVTVNLE